MVYTESETVEKPILKWLQELGWDYIAADSIERDLDDAFDVERLKIALRKLNPDILSSDEYVEQVINKLRLLPNDIRGNKEFFDWLKNEASISLRRGEPRRTITLIDYDNLENNIFTVTNQFKFSGYQNIRPDIILFINGIPLVLIEAKTQVSGFIDYNDAINQIIRYSRQAPQLFKYLAYTCATDGAAFRYGWTDPDRYFRWKDGYDDPLEATVKNLFQRNRLLDFMRNFIIFETFHEEVTKKIAMQQQYEATNKIVDRALKRDEDRDRGLIWHTQGSGKTLTMLFTAWKLKRQPQLENPTIVVMIDRLQLQTQFSDTFRNIDMRYVTLAETSRDLFRKIRNQSREIIITTIQKFRTARVQDRRSNIIILIDEAHRTQYGRLAIRMRKVFPNAKIFGFTGTPIDKGPTGRSTFRIFSLPDERYLHKYNIKQSIEDGSTVPIVYQPRITREHIPKEILDREFLEITKDRNQEEQREILEKSAKLKTILKADHRIQKIAKDIAEHYQSHIEPNGFKAQLVCVDREACALYKEELDRHHLPPEYSTVIYSSSPGDSPLLKKYHMSREKQLDITRKVFQKPDTLPNILIVTEMLLTGFDAPIERVMYLDKPLRDHKLLQAIARTNRPYPNKHSALIVDYIGIFYRLQDALNFEVEDIEGVAEVIDALKLEFQETINRLRKIFTDIPREDSRGRSLIEAIKVLTDEQILREFKDNLFKARALFETISPDPDLEPLLQDYTWFIKINEAYNKYIRADKESLKPYQEKTKRLIRDMLILKEIDDTLPSLEIGPEYLEKLEEADYDTVFEAAELRQAIGHYIRINIELNPVCEKLSEKLERIIKRKDPERMKVELKKLVEEINGLEKERKEKGLTREEHALFTVAKGHLEDRSEEEIIGFVTKLMGELEDQDLFFKGWQNKTETQKDVKRAIFARGFDKFSDSVEPAKIMELTDELLDFIIRYRS